MKVLLVEPAYYTRFPPLGLLKLASYHRSRGNDVRLVRGIKEDLEFKPDRIEITSLFTYAWKPVHEAIKYYHDRFRSSRIRLGGIYASMMPDRLRSFFPFIDIHLGLFKEADYYLPSYDLLDDIEKWRGWDSTILFTSRGCIRNCSYCIVPTMEGRIRSVVDDVERHVYPGHKRIILWDNNLLASPNWRRILEGLRDIGLPVDFNQGIDARLVNEEKAQMIADLRIRHVRTAFDTLGQGRAISKAVELLSGSGIRRRRIFIYTLYNFYDGESPSDTPSTFLKRIQEIAQLGCVSYPMRYEPLTSIVKNRFVSPSWTTDQLEMVAKARRVLGYGGAFPPYKGLVKKFEEAQDFDDAFSVYPLNRDKATQPKPRRFTLMQTPEVTPGTAR